MSNIKDIYLSKYKQYLIDPISNVQNINELIYLYSNIASLWTEDLFIECRKNSLHNKTRNLYEHTLLKTNGSTGIEYNQYKWGPNFHIITNYIWDSIHRKNHNFENRYWITMSNKNVIMNTKFNEGILLLLDPKKKINLNINKSAFITFPSTLNLLLEYPFFVDFMIKNCCVISITCSDSSFYDFSKLKELNIPLINQMRSWKEGTTFYTCPYDKIHWMENLFYCTSNRKIFDLFNFHNNWWQEKESNTDNIWPLEDEFHECECGAWYRKMNFQPHAIKWLRDYTGNISTYQKNITTKSFEVQYNNFQIIQKTDLKTFEIYTNTEIYKKDFLYIQNYLFHIYKSRDFEMKNIIGEYKIGINQKHPIYWSEYEINKPVKKIFKTLCDR